MNLSNQHFLTKVVGLLLERWLADLKSYWAFYYPGANSSNIFPQFFIRCNYIRYLVSFHNHIDIRHPFELALSQNQRYWCRSYNHIAVALMYDKNGMYDKLMTEFSILIDWTGLDQIFNRLRSKEILKINCHFDVMELSSKGKFV